MYRYGFYQFTIPEVQFGFLYSVLIVMALYTRLVYKAEILLEDDKRESGGVMTNIWGLNKNTLF